MLREQRAEAEELYEARAVRLERMLEEWKTKHAKLRRRFSLETEGFRRDADNIGRYCCMACTRKEDTFVLLLAVDVGEGGGPFVKRPEGSNQSRSPLLVTLMTPAIAAVFSGQLVTTLPLHHEFFRHNL